MSVKVQSRLDLGPITRQNIGTLKRLNGVILPVPYSDKVYDEVISEKLEDFCKLVYYNDVPVGSVCCRIENDKVYIMIMEVLAPYRRQGLGAYMLNHIINVTKSNNKLNKIYLHVQKGNDDGLSFYKSQGFEIENEVEDYYKKLNDNSSRNAYLLVKNA